MQCCLDHRGERERKREKCTDRERQRQRESEEREREREVGKERQKPKGKGRIREGGQERARETTDRETYRQRGRERQRQSVSQRSVFVFRKASGRRDAAGLSAPTPRKCRFGNPQKNDNNFETNPPVQNNQYEMNR